MTEPTYTVVRFFQSDEPGQQLIASGLPLDIAQAWCRDPDHNSATCQHDHGLRLLATKGPWFDGYRREHSIGGTQ